MAGKKGSNSSRAAPEQLRLRNGAQRTMIHAGIIYQGSAYRLVKGTLRELCYVREDKLRRHM